MAPLLLLEGLTLAAAWQVLAAILPVWLLGAVTGYLVRRLCLVSLVVAFVR